MDFELENELRPALDRDERFVWTGQPKKGIVFRSSDLFVVPFSLFWCGFVTFWEYMALTMGGGFFALFGIPFILVGLYLLIGRFFFDALRRKKTIYGITGERVIIRSGIFSRQISSFAIRTLPQLVLKEKADGSGTITFGQNDARYERRMATLQRDLQTSSSLEMIDNVRNVYNILVGTQRRLS
ncbi:MAG: hypothetical protein ABW019_03535 [Chitinophagaceae bacterium]